MKKTIIVVMLATLITSANAQTYNRGMGIWQRVAVAQNFIDPLDHHNFLKYGKVFQGMNASLVYGGDTKTRNVVWNDYVKNTANMAEVSLNSLVAVLQYITLQTGNSLGGYVSNTKALDILLSDMITIGDMPTGVIVFDTYYQKTNTIGAVTRPRHWLPKVGEWEQCLFLNIPGYEPIPIRSAYCGNNIAQVSLEKFIKKKSTTIIPGKVDPKQEEILIFEGCTIQPEVLIFDGCTTTGQKQEFFLDEDDMFFIEKPSQNNSSGDEMFFIEKLKQNSTPAIAPKAEQPVQQKTQPKVEWSIVTD